MKQITKEIKDIRDYLHLYLGGSARAWISPLTSDVVVINPTTLDYLGGFYIEVKPILRKLSSMTEEEAWEFLGGKSDHLYDDLKLEQLDSKGIEISYTIDADEEGRFPQTHRVSFMAFSPKEFTYLLSKGFDLFGLIDSGLALDKENKA